ncbi:DUF3068 domain-containing protein [Corynebacterium sp. HS2168-gen11]|uniref:DUF3068 domain-containing protein n=1 Tax=Corynebacterium sp. HS2168-gen11 TaxID=2974027 RepID=UPI00216B3FDF|nr:DUF3068 domain-containing protein [Corynebacterium sp. HS2168-gen11]MCS4535734.1 DUF3068 domain-containing protein [Corynebacterium sp. HS2168-gen11]
MLPTSRIVAAMMIGIGCMLAVVGIVLPQAVAFDARVPLELSHREVSLRDPAATMRVVGDGSTYDGPAEKRIHVSFLPPFDAQEVTAQVGVTLVRGEADRAHVADIYTAETLNYSFDRVTGANLSPVKIISELASPARTVEFAGLWLKFPAPVAQTAYEFFDLGLEATAPMVFERSSMREGRELYHFVQEIAPTELAGRYPSVLHETVIDDSVAKLMHAVKREITVDTISGLIVDISEQVDDVYVNEEGQPVGVALKFHGMLDESDKQALFAQAARISDQHWILWVLWALTGVGVLLILGGLAGAFLRRQ